MPDSKSIFLRDLFLRNKRDLYNYLRRHVGPDDASDLLQETFVRALRHDRCRVAVDPPAFLQQIAINLTRDFVRRRKVEGNCLVFGELPEDAPSNEASPQARLETDEKSRLLREAVEGLPPRCREAFLIYFGEAAALRDREVARHFNQYGAKACAARVSALQSGP